MMVARLFQNVTGSLSPGAVLETCYRQLLALRLPRQFHNQLHY